jgi:hypothetical protein
MLSVKAGLRYLCFRFAVVIGIHENAEIAYMMGKIQSQIIVMHRKKCKTAYPEAMPS